MHGILQVTTCGIKEVDFMNTEITKERLTEWFYPTEKFVRYTDNAVVDYAEIEIKPEGIGSGENIVFVANQFWNASGSSDDKFNYLIVGTQSGDNYKLYFYNINGGAPDGKPLMTKEGKGKVKCIRFLNTKYSGGGMASTLDYNAND